MSRGSPPVVVRVEDVCEGSPGLTGDSLDDPECTSAAASAVTSIWKEKEAASTQRLRSPKVRWKAEMSAAPRTKETMAVSDLSQAREGVLAGREFAPRARKIVFPVCLVWNLSIYFFPRRRLSLPLMTERLSLDYDLLASTRNTNMHCTPHCLRAQR